MTSLLFTLRCQRGASALGRTLAAVFIAVSLLAASAAQAQTWPTKPVRLLHPYGAGSGSDQIARVIANDLQLALGQPVLVEPKPGAAGNIAAEFVAKSPPDGYVLFQSPSAIHAANPHLYKKLPYDPIKDFTPIGLICTVAPVLAVDANLPVRSVSELLAYARTNDISYGYGNSQGHMGGAALVKLGKIKATAVPYKSSVEVLRDMVGGRIAFTFIDLGAARPLAQAGKIRLIASATESGSVLVPDLPTVSAAGGMPNFDVTGWTSLVGPPGLAPEVVARLNTALNATLKRKEVSDKLLSIGCEVRTSTPGEFSAYMVKQLEVMGQRMRDAGIQPE